jgi:ATP phosphoribosyltransferase
MMKNTLTIAVSKGRILEECLPLLEQAGIRLLEDPGKTRKLILETSRADLKIIIVRATDVPTYVAYGAADLGVAGKDVLLEYGGDGLYEPLDLGIARCRMMLAGPAQATNGHGRLRIATKYVNTTRRYFADQGKQVELIKLYGSMELAPLLGLADRIVDLVDTGKTLKENGLTPLELITDISSRLIVNKAAMKMKHGIIKPLIDDLARTVAR